MDTELIAQDNYCDFGKWLYGEGKVKFGSTDSYADCVSKHATFHVEAGKVAATINAQRYSEAQSMIDTATPYARASLEVASAILKLKSEMQQ